MFKFWKKEEKYPLPSNYEGLISQEAYNRVIEICKDYFQQRNIPIKQIKEGDIIIDLGDENENHCYLDNLVRKLSHEDMQSWPQYITEHFDKLKDNSSAYDYLFTDFDYSQQLLRYLVKPTDILPEDQLADFVYRIDFPETYTFLVLEYENQFKYLKKEDIVTWDIPEADLFDIALDKVALEAVAVKEYVYDDRFTVFAYLDGDYAASYLVDIENNAPNTIGPLGSLVAIPTKGTAFVHPIEGDDILDLIELLMPAVANFYNEDPGNITLNFYWYYQNKFEIFPIEQEGEGQLISLPKGFVELLKNYDAEEEDF